MYLLELSLGSIPFKIVPLCSDTSIAALLLLLERVLEVLVSKHTKDICDPAGSPPLYQNGDPLAAASSLRRGRSHQGPNLVSNVDE
jgi:hypothetical protein